MAETIPAWFAFQRERWRRHDWRKWARPDAGGQMSFGRKTFLRPGSDQQWTQRYHEDICDPAILADLVGQRAALLRLKGELAAVKAGLKFRRFLQTLKYSPDQPRVPAGNPDGGQWTNGDGGGVRTAAADKPSLGPLSAGAIVTEVARRAIEAYRSGNFLRDLFGSKIGTVTVTEINGEQIFGSNSTSPPTRMQTTRPR